MTVEASSQISEPNGKLAQKWESWRASLSSRSDAIRLAGFVRLAHLVSDDEHVAVLEGSPDKFNLLRRKDDLFDDGVAAIFGMLGEEAELLGFCFHAESFTGVGAMKWLAERRFVT